jgi:hypothetical protein
MNRQDKNGRCKHKKLFTQLPLHREIPDILPAAQFRENVYLVSVQSTDTAQK